MYYRLMSLFCGLLFGIGMIISGMADPEKVIGFLNITNHWDPSLLFVMGGALAVFTPVYQFVIKSKHKPVNADEFCLATTKTLDTRLILGAAIFGLGWGLAGICPGPAVSSLALGNQDVWVFFIAMVVGMGIVQFSLNKKLSLNKKHKSIPDKPIQD